MNSAVPAFLSRIAVVAVVAAAAMVPAAPASAAVAVQYVTGTTAEDSSSTKHLTLFCPAGWVAISGGAQLAGSAGEAYIWQVRPNYDGDGRILTVRASEDNDGYSGSWSLSATAICVPRPAGFRYVAIASSAPDEVWAGALCGQDHVIGSGFLASDVVMYAGYLLQGPYASVGIQRSQVPDPNPSPNVSGFAIAACADQLLPGTQQVAAIAPEDTTATKTAVATCPSGTSVVGVTGLLTDEKDHAVLSALHVVSNGVTVTGVNNQLGIANSWGVIAFAICAG